MLVHVERSYEKLPHGCCVVERHLENCILMACVPSKLELGPADLCDPEEQAVKTTWMNKWAMLLKTADKEGSTMAWCKQYDSTAFDGLFFTLWIYNPLFSPLSHPLTLLLSLSLSLSLYIFTPTGPRQMITIWSLDLLEVSSHRGVFPATVPQFLLWKPSCFFLFLIVQSTSIHLLMLFCAVQINIDWIDWLKVKLGHLD